MQLRYGFRGGRIGEVVLLCLLSLLVSGMERGESAEQVDLPITFADRRGGKCQIAAKLDDPSFRIQKGDVLYLDWESTRCPLSGSILAATSAEATAAATFDPGRDGVLVDYHVDFLRSMDSQSRLSAKVDGQYKEGFEARDVRGHGRDGSVISLALKEHLMRPVPVGQSQELTLLPQKRPSDLKGLSFSLRRRGLGQRHFICQEQRGRPIAYFSLPADSEKRTLRIPPAGSLRWEGTAKVVFIIPHGSFSRPRPMLHYLERGGEEASGDYRCEYESDLDLEGCRPSFSVSRLEVQDGVASVLFPGGFVLSTAPWTYRNYRVHHAFVPVSTNGGLNLLIANSPAASFDKSMDMGADGGRRTYHQKKVELLSRGMSAEAATDKAKQAAAEYYILQNPWRRMSLVYALIIPFPFAIGFFKFYGPPDKPANHPVRSSRRFRVFGRAFQRANPIGDQELRVHKRRRHGNRNRSCAQRARWHPWRD